MRKNEQKQWLYVDPFVLRFLRKVENSSKLLQLRSVYLTLCELSSLENSDIFHTWLKTICNFSGLGLNTGSLAIKKLEKYNLIKVTRIKKNGKYTKTKFELVDISDDMYQKIIGKSMYPKEEEKSEKIKIEKIKIEKIKKSTTEKRKLFEEKTKHKKVPVPSKRGEPKILDESHEFFKINEYLLNIGYEDYIEYDYMKFMYSGLTAQILFRYVVNVTTWRKEKKKESFITCQQLNVFMKNYDEKFGKNPKGNNQPKQNKNIGDRKKVGEEL